MVVSLGCNRCDELKCGNVVVLWEGCVATGGSALLHLTGGSDGHFCPSTSTLRSDSFHLLHDVHTFCHLPEDNVLSIQPRGHNRRYEELVPGELNLWCVAGCRRTCEPLVLGPAFAMDKRPGRLCLNLKFSSIGTVEGGQKREVRTGAPGNISPKTDFPPVPL